MLINIANRLLGKLTKINSALTNLIELSKNSFSISFFHCIQKLFDRCFSCNSEKSRDIFFIDRSKNAHLIYIFHCISHASFRNIGDDIQSFRTCFQSFCMGDMRKMLNHCRIGNFPIIENLTTRNDGIRHLMNFRSRKNEADIAFWLFDCFQKCIESSFTQHMYLINYVDFLFEGCRWIKSFIDDLFPNIVYSRMRSRIDLRIIQTCSLIDEFTVRTMVTRVSILEIKTVESLGNQSC